MLKGGNTGFEVLEAFSCGLVVPGAQIRIEHRPENELGDDRHQPYRRDLQLPERWCLLASTPVPCMGAFLDVSEPQPPGALLALEGDMAASGTRASLVLCLLMGCEARVGVTDGLLIDGPPPLGGNGPTDVDETGAPDFSCTPDNGASRIDLRRLTKQQYLNTVASLLQGLTVNERQRALDALMAIDFPDDAAVPFLRADANLSNAHITAYHHVARAFGDHLTASPAVLDKLVAHFTGLGGTPCLTAASMQSNAGCRDRFIDGFVLRVYRRPLSAEEKGLFAQTFTAQSNAGRGVSSIAYRAMLSPQFLFQLENNGTEAHGGTTLELTDYELAARLSYHFWNMPPDEALLAAAKDGSIRDPLQYATIVERLAAAPQAKATLTEFFEGYLGLHRIPSFAGASRPEFVHLSKGLTFDDTLHAAIAKEARDFSTHLTWNAQGSFSELFTSPTLVTNNPSLRSLYGVSDSNAVATLNAAERAGVLTRAALLVSGSPYESPIHRGLHVMKDFLCYVPPQPMGLPDDAFETPKLDAALTTRQRYENKTAGESCQNCHKTINGFGFGLNNYDALGFYRERETIFADDGSIIGTLPVDGQVDLAMLGDARDVKTPVDYSRAVGESRLAQMCVSRKYFEFTYGRPSNDRADGCSLHSMRQAAGQSSPGGMLAFLKSVALDEGFRQKRVGAP